MDSSTRASNTPLNTSLQVNFKQRSRPSGLRIIWAQYIFNMKTKINKSSMWNFSRLLPRSHILPNQHWLLSETRPWIRHDLTWTSSSRVLLPQLCMEPHTPEALDSVAPEFDLRGTTDSTGIQFQKKSFLLNPTLVTAFSPPQCFYALGPQWWYILQMTFFFFLVCLYNHAHGCIKPLNQA